MEATSTMRQLPARGGGQDEKDYFDRFHRRYLSSMPSRVAMARFDYSVGEQSKVESYLRVAYPRPPKPQPPAPRLPPLLLSLLKAQEDDGRWSPSPGVVEALGGEANIPDPPANSVGGWRWTTALVLALIRQEGLRYVDEEELFQGYQRAASLVSEEALQAARLALPPRDNYFQLDPDLVKTGRWRNCASARDCMETQGYQAFVNEKMRTTILGLQQREDGDAASVGSRTIRTETGAMTTTSLGSMSTKCGVTALLQDGFKSRSQLLREKMEKEREEARRKQAKAREEWRQQMLALEYRLLSRPPSHAAADSMVFSASMSSSSRSPNNQQAAPSINSTATIPSTSTSTCSGKVRDLTVVKHLWEAPIPDAEERQRLQALQKKVREPTKQPWVQSNPSLEFHCTKHLPISMVTSPAFRPAASSSPGIVNPRSQARTAPHHGENETRHRRRRRSLTSAEGRHSPEADHHHQPQHHHHLRQPSGALSFSPAREATQSRVVSSILSMEQYIADLRACIDRCLVQYRKCRLHSERMDLLDEVTAMLGQRQPPQRGFQDWRGRGVVGMHNVICNVVEAVQHWRCAIYQEEHAAALKRAAEETEDLLLALELQNRAKAMVVRRMPFIYNGENILLQLPYVCEFLAGVPELVAHYGADFKWHRNPFLRGTTLDERAVTPRRATRSVKIGDEVVEEVVESLMEARRGEEVAMRVMQDKLDRAGFWWPGIGAGKKHLERIRAAEKVMLEEEAEHGPRPQLSFFFYSHQGAGSGGAGARGGTAGRRQQ